MLLGKPKKKLPRKMKDVKAKQLTIKFAVFICPYCNTMNGAKEIIEPGDIAVCHSCDKPANITEVERC